MSLVIDLTETDAANEATEKVAKRAADDAEQTASDETSGAPRRKKPRTSDEDERERFRKHAEDIAVRHIVKGDTCDVEAEDGTYSGHIEDPNFQANDEGVKNALEEYYNDDLPDLANDIATLYNAEVEDWATFLGPTMVHVEIKVEVANGKMKVVEARVPPITQAQYHAIRAIMHDN